MKTNQKPTGYWNDFANVEEAIRIFIEEHGTPGMMPTAKQLHKAGFSSFVVAIQKHGGFPVVAERLGLTPISTAKPRGYWDELAHVEHELRAFIDERYTQGLMPTLGELEKAGYSSLSAAIRRHGGVAALAKRLRLEISSSKKPYRYWDVFAHLEQELQTFIQEHGSPGIMPTQEELKKAGRGDLPSAISKHGGMAVVAERLGLKLTSTAKPNGYWNDFANVAEELFAFIEQYGTPGVMPTWGELKKAGRGDLAKAIRKHGGVESVAQKLGSRIISTANLEEAKEINLVITPLRKPDRYWNDFTNVAEELFAFIEQYGTPGIMPTSIQLQRADCSTLSAAIGKHGGMAAVAQKLGLRLASTGKPNGYWNDFDHIKEGIDAFIKEYGTSGVMPTQEELKKAGRHDLIRVMHIHGGFRTVAGRLGLEYIHTAKPRGYWDDFTHLKEVLYAFVEKQGTPGVMPTAIQLRKAGYSSLSDVIKTHGGFSAVAEKLGLALSYTVKPANYWDDFAHLEQELRAFIQEHGTPGIMPTLEDLKKAGRNDLPTVINKHGGVKAVAQQLGLEIGYSRRPAGYWDDFVHLEEAIRTFIEERGTPGVMPTHQELRQADLGDLPSFISKHGGMAVVAERLGLKLTSTAKPHGHWDDFANVEKAIRTFIEEHGTPGIMPTLNQLRKADLYNLVHAIYKYGGFSAVAHHLDLSYTGQERIPPHTASTVERIARAIQPLAESNLLSGAQIMVILRRAGMLSFRNSRISRLNASLVNGEHNEIERALSELRMELEELATESINLEEKANEDLTAQVEAAISHTLEPGDGAMLATSLLAAPVPDIKQEQAIIRGLSALGEMRLPLDEILVLLTSKVLWEAFYKRLYMWYGSLNATQTVDYEDIQAAILSTYPEHMDNEFVAKASAIFLQEVQQAVNFMAVLPKYGWQGPRLRLHQADAARRMADVLMSQGKQPFLLNADDPGMGKSTAFLAAVATSGVRSVILVAPKTVADDTWAAFNGEIHRCLPHAHIVRGINNAIMAAYPLQLTFFILHYEEMLNMDAVVNLTERHVDCLCIDEIHLIKQRADQENTHRRAAIEALRASVHTAIGLTGTPLVNELTEPMSILQTLSLHDPQFDHTRLSNHRMSDIADVFEAMLPHIVRRRKKDVLLHLPECDVHTVDLTVSIDIDEQMRDVYSWPKAKTSQAIVELRKLATDAKLPYILHRAQNADKLLILTYLTEEISEKIASYLEDFFPGQIGHINGQVAKDERQECINSFRASNGIRILVGTIGTIGVGLTLFDPIQENTACEIIVADLPYTSAEFDQGIARLHREGQKHRVMVDILQTTTRATLRDGSALLTIDQRIWELIVGKRELSDVAIDGKYDTTDSAAKVRKALHRWLKQAREIGIESLGVERRPAEQSDAQKWRGEIGRLRAMSASKADEVFANPEYAHDFLHHLKASIASKLAHLWLRARLERLLRPDLEVIDMGCGLNPFADLSCHVIGLDRHDLPGQLRGKMENPPLSDRSADVLIYSLSLYGTADDLLAYFTHASRILKGGGHLFIVEPASTFTSEGIVRFLHGLRQFGFEQVDTIKDLRGEDGVLLKGMHFTLTGEMGQPEAVFFERK